MNNFENINQTTNEKVVLPEKQNIFNNTKELLASLNNNAFETVLPLQINPFIEKINNNPEYLFKITELLNNTAINVGLLNPQEIKTA